MTAVTRRARRRAPALAVTLALAATCAAAAPPTVGVLVARAGEGLSETEARAADALVAALVERDLRAVLLHDQSPLLRARNTQLPAIAATDDWTPLGPVLGRLAARLQLDYVALIAVAPADTEDAPSRLMLVVRDGRAQSVALGPPGVSDDAGPEAFGERVAERLVALIDKLGEPQEPDDEAVTAPAPAAPAEPTAPTTPAPALIEETGAPVIEPPTAPGEEGRPPDEMTDPLVPAQQAYERGDYEGALRLLRELGTTADTDARLHLLHAKVLLAMQARAEALAALERAVALDPTLVEARLWLARLQAEQGLWQAAVEQYELALAAEPANHEALLGLARVYRDHGHRRKAIELLTTAKDAGQGDADVLVLLAELHEAEGELEMAQRLLVQAAALTGGDRTAEILERLGDLYAQRRLHREALSCYQRAAEINPSRASMAQRRYLEVMAAADNSVSDALTAGWSAFRDYVDHQVGEREPVFRAFSQVRDQIEEALEFADSVTPPEALRAEHARRQYAYSLALEATVAALTYLDLGEPEMKTRAALCYQDALAEFDALRGELGR